MAATPSDREQLETRLKGFAGIAAGPPEIARDVVEAATIRHWCDALGDRNPIYTDPVAAAASVHGRVVAPPTMLQAWVLPGIEMASGVARPGDKQRELHALLDRHGYTGVVATNCQQGYDRYLHLGERVTGTTVIESISGEKATALGIGYFIDTRTTFRDDDGERVGWMTFRVLKFKPATPPVASERDAAGAPVEPRRLRPALGHDNAWWWEGIRRGELLIQRCKSCGHLRHPPRPMCGECRSLEWDALSSKGHGSVYSFVVMHHPQVPGYEYPLIVALVELDEGTRLIANLTGIEPRAVRIGLRVALAIEAVDPELSLPFFHPDTTAPG